MIIKQLSLIILLIPWLAFATQQPAQDSGKKPDSGSDMEIDTKESDRKNNEDASRIQESDSSIPASRSYAVGNLLSSAENNQNHENKLNEIDRPKTGSAYYARAEAIIEKALKLLDIEAYNALYDFLGKPCNHIRMSTLKSEIATFEAIDHGDVEFVREHLTKAPGPIFDMRLPFLNFIQHISTKEENSETERRHAFSHFLSALNIAEGFTPLMRASARRDKQMVAMLLANDQYTGKPLMLRSWMVDPNAEVNTNILGRLVTKDLWGCLIFIEPKMMLSKLVDNVARMENYFDTQAVSQLIIGFTELSLAAIGGHEEVVDLLLVQENFSHDVCNLINSLSALSAYSSIAHLPAARVLFKNLGIPGRPQYENYPVIARKLSKALKAKLDPARVEWVKTTGRNIHFSDTYSLSEMNTITRAIMHYGSTEMALAIADEFSQAPDKSIWFDKFAEESRPSLFEILVRYGKNGEKLGLILSMNSHPQSLTSQLGMGMLSLVDKNQVLLANLKKYIEDNARISNAVNGHLPPVLSPLVADYVLPRMPAEYIRYIMALEYQPDENQRQIQAFLALANPDQDENQGLLGEHMQGIMRADQPVMDRNERNILNTSRRSMCAWLMHKMFEVCRRRNL